MWKLRCTRCPSRWEDCSEQKEQSSCPACGALTRMDVVRFGKSLNPHRLAATIAAIQHAALRC
ncbi:MAG: hypothetical protein JXA97_00560 [Anaerolineales bacterium]|nr:hypothetical protein [Anaerolineales bacterium]